jgi:hypothetical protein
MVAWSTPDALVGEMVAKMFDNTGDDVLCEGTITKFSKWWTVLYSDGDTEDLNFKQLTQLDKPPCFDKLQYPTPDEACATFLKKTNGVNSLMAVKQKGGELCEFKLEEDLWTLVSVFLVQDSKRPLQGVYVAQEDFHEDMRELGLAELQNAHPNKVRLSPMEDIRHWIETTELSCHPAEKAPDAALAVSQETQETVDEDEFIVEAVVAGPNRKGQYEVKWAGYPSTQNTWEPGKELPKAFVASYKQTKAASSDVQARPTKKGKELIGKKWWDEVLGACVVTKSCQHDKQLCLAYTSTVPDEDGNCKHVCVVEEARSCIYPA